MSFDSSFPDCRRCRWFYITWDPEKPYGCRAMQFKSQKLPALEVLEADGSVCMSFKKKRKNVEVSKKALNTDKSKSKMDLKA